MATKIEACISDNNTAEKLSEKELTLLLISMYRESPCLWNVKSKEYMDRQKKSIAWNNILTVINRHRTMDEREAKRKINTLRTNCRREHKKVLSAVKSGMSESAYMPTLFYYEDFKFVCDQDSDTRTSSETSHPTSYKIKRSTTKFMDMAYEHLNKPLRDSEIITKGWAIKLDRMTAEQRRHAEKFICDVLYEGESGNLSRDCAFVIPSDGSSTPNYSPLRSPVLHPTETGRSAETDILKTSPFTDRSSTSS